MKYYKYTYKKYWSVIITILTFVIFLSLPTKILLAFTNLYIEMVVMLFIFVLHELLHGLGFKVCGKAKTNNIVYGVKLESGILYCACKEEISKNGIIGSLLAPLIFLTVLPITVGLIFNLYTLILIGIINLLGAAFDILATIDIVRLPKNINYKDLDDTLGFILISNDDLSKHKYLGLKILEQGNYDSAKIKAIKYDKLTISKPSTVVFIVIIILLIISFVL
jgi:hypothetical protein